MTVANGKDGLRSFAGDDVTDTFAITFGFDGADALVAVLRGTADSLPAFTVNGTLAQMRAGAATITLTAVVPATGETLIVSRDTPAAQGSDYDDSAAFPSDDVELRLDYLIRALGDLQRKLDRAVLGDILDTVPFEFPPEATRAEKMLSFDAAGLLEAMHPISDFVGPAFAWDAEGTLAGRDAFDAEAQGFAYLATDQDPPLLYFRDSETEGEWSDGIPFVGAGDATVIRVPASGVDATDPDAIVITTGSLPSVKTDQVKLRFVPEAANTGPMTLEARKDVSTSWGAEAVVDRAGDPLAASALVVGVPAEAVFSTTLDAWVLLTPPSLAAYATSAAVASALAAYAQFGAKQAWAKPQRPAPEAVAYAGTWAPDLAAGPLKVVAELTGSFQIDLPVNCALYDQFTILLLQDGTGSRAITMDAGYVNDPAAFVSDAGKRMLIDCMVTAVSGTDATQVWVLGASIEP